MALIDEHLADWLQGVVLLSTPDQLGPYLSTVRAVAAKSSPQAAIDLVGYACGVDSGGAALELITAAASETIPSWTGGERLQKLLAGAAVDPLLQGPASVATATALAMSSAEFIEAKLAVAELETNALTALAALADKARTVDPVAPSLRASFDAKVGDLPPEDATALTNTDLRAHLTRTRAASRAMADEADRAISASLAVSARTSEEIDLLWWSQAPFSEHVGTTWEKAGPGATLACAIEISRRLRITPPPRGVGGIVDIALRSAGVDPDAKVDLETLSVPLAQLEDVALPSRAARSWAQPLKAALGLDGSAPAPLHTVTVHRAWALQLIREFSLDRVLST